MQINIIAAIISLAAGSAAVRIKIWPNAGSDCGGDGLPSDTTGSSLPINACFDLSNAQSFSWKHISRGSTQSDYAKFRYYSETGCNGDVTAVKVLCGEPSDGTCYNKHDPNAGSVKVQLPDSDDTCQFYEEGEEECPTPDAPGLIDHTQCA
jgi:hypothetical protein